MQLGSLDNDVQSIRPLMLVDALILIDGFNEGSWEGVEELLERELFMRGIYGLGST